MYLSRLILNPRSRAVRNDLGDCRGLHRTILSAFPQAIKDQEGARAEFGVLYRADTDPRSGKIALLVQSQTEPEWSNLPSGYLIDDFDEMDNPAIKRIDQVYGSLSNGTRLRFRLRANPTRRVSQQSANEKSNGYGKRVEIYEEEKQIEWLQRKGEQNGFRLLTVRANPGVHNVHARPEAKAIGWRDRSQPPMKFGAVLFEGQIEILDAAKFVEALSKGIGSGKAYGFGLLSIAKIINQ